MNHLYGNFSKTSGTNFSLSAVDNSSLTLQATNGTGNTTVRDSSTVMPNSASSMTFWFATIYVIIPCVAVVGIVGNIISIIVLKRHGLQRSSYILLISLAVADTVYLVGLINIPEMMYKFLQGLYMSPSVNMFLYIWRGINNFMRLFGLCSSLTLPVLITLERLIAVFFPLRLTTIATVKRTTIAVTVLFSFWVLATIYYLVLVDMNFEAAVIGDSEKVVTYILQFIALVILHLLGTVSVFLVTIGCLIVGIKSKIAMRRRARMTSSVQGSRSRTTKTLLAVCFMYVIANGYGTIFYSILPYIPSHRLELYAIDWLLKCLNSSWNFVIYVLINNTFRMTYLSLASAALPCLKKIQILRTNRSAQSGSF